MRGKRFWRRAAGGLLAAALCLTCCACDGEDPAEVSSGVVSGTGTQETQQAFFTVAYRSGSSLNPLATDSAINLALADLQFESLVRLGKDFSPELYLAERIDNSADYRVYTVTVRQDIVFSDGSPLTAEDVRQTLEAVAATPTSAYYGRLAQMESVTTVGEYQVVITLRTPDPYFRSALSLPIVKAGSLAADARGTGRYVIGQDESGTVLSYNPNWHGGAVETQTIRLYDLEDADALRYSLKTGEIDFLYTEAVGEAVSTASTLEVSMQQAALLVPNCNRAPFSDAAFRRALSAMLDREALMSAADAYGRLAVTPLHPEHYALSGLQLPSVLTGDDVTEQAQAMIALLESMGYTSVDAGTGIRYRTQGNQTQQLQFRLTYLQGDSAREAFVQSLADQLLAVGIGLTLQPCGDETELATAVAGGDYDLLLTEVRLSPQGDLSSLIGAGGLFSAAQGTAYTTTQAAYLAAWSGTDSMQTFLNTFAQELPYIPLFYRNAAVMYSRDFDAGIEARPDAVFYNAQTWKIYG